MYTLDNCTDEDIMTTDLVGRFVILQEDFLNDQYRDEEYQLVRVFRENDKHLTVIEENNDKTKYNISHKEAILGIATDRTVRMHRDRFISE